MPRCRQCWPTSRAAVLTDIGIWRSRWVTAVDAIANGAQLEHVARAMGLDVDEVTAGLRSWADGQHDRCGMSAAARDDVYALLGEMTRVTASVSAWPTASASSAWRAMRSAGSGSPMP